MFSVKITDVLRFSILESKGVRLKKNKNPFGIGELKLILAFVSWVQNYGYKRYN